MNLYSQVNNNSVCGVFGCQRIVDPFWLDSVSSAPKTIDIIGLGFALFFVILVIFAIFRIIKAVYQILLNAEKSDIIKDQSKVIQNIFVSIGMLFIGFIGLLIIFAFFGFNVPSVSLS